MSHFLKSVLFGFAGGALGLLAIYLAEQFRNRRAGKHPVYDAEYVFSFPSKNDSNSQAAAKSVAVIRNRFSAGGYDHKFTSEPNGQIRLVVTNVGDSGSVIKLLTNPGRLSFNEVYSVVDLATPFTTADSLLARGYRDRLPPPSTDTVNLPVPDIINADPLTYSNNPLFTMVRFASSSPDYPNPYIGYVKAKDSHMLIQLLSRDTIRSLFPRDVIFMYGAPYIDLDIPLLAVRAVPESNDAYVDESDITSVQLQIGTGQKNPSLISVAFDNQGSYHLEKLTRRNTGKPIAIIMDNVVVSAPTVTEPITEGETNLNMAEEPLTKYLAGMLAGGRLHQAPAIISGKITPASAVFRKVRSMGALWLSGLVAFILVFTTYFILRRPKKNN